MTRRERKGRGEVHGRKGLFFFSSALLKRMTLKVVVGGGGSEGIIEKRGV